MSNPASDHFPSTLWKIWYGLFYCGIIAAAYLFVRTHTSDGGIAIFGSMAILVFVIHLMIWPKLTFLGLRDKRMWARGFFYGVTQILVLKAQSSGFTSTAFVSSIMGSVFGVILGRVILKERIQGLAIVGAAFCFIAVFLNPMIILQSYWGLVGGFTQGLSFVLARSLMTEKRSIRQSIATGFFVSAVITVAFLTTTSSPRLLLEVNFHDLIIVTALGIIIQYGFFYLYKMLDTQRASLVALSRLPWAMALERIIYGNALLLPQILSSTLIMIGSAFLLFDAKTKRRSDE